MNPQQYGFRPHRCTEDIIVQIIKYIDTYHKLNKKTATVSLDVEKAFDKVWHQGLTYKIYNHYNIPTTTKKLLSNFILERTYTILHKNTKSTTFSSNAGVPQGSSLSPTLFALYVNDTPTPLNDKAQTFIFADDITLLTHHKDRWALRREITTELTQLENYHSLWLINTNKSKSNIILYNQHMNQVNGQPAIRINGEMIPYTSQAKILGTTFDNKLLFKNHIDERLKTAKFTSSRLTRFLTLNTKLQLYLYRTLALSQIIYSPTPIIYNNKYALQKIQKFQNKTLRKIYCIKWDQYIKNIEIHQEKNIEETTPIIYRRFINQYDKTYTTNTRFFDQLNNSLNNRDTKFTIMLANPPDNILQ